MPDAKFYCGTSGFAYSRWKPDFYPQNLAATELLPYYATRLNAVELRYPARFNSAATLRQWAEVTPNGFLFLPKASVQLGDADQLIATISKKLESLRTAKRLGPFLFQVGANCKADPNQLHRFVQRLPEGLQVAFEFRNVSWFDESVYKILRDANAALCLTESEELETPWVLTADFVYLRLHKLEYLESKLTSMQYRVEQYLANAYPTFALFKSGKRAAGALNAEKLFVTQRMIGTV